MTPFVMMPPVLSLTYDVVLQVEVLQGGRASQRLCGHSLQPVAVQSELLQEDGRVRDVAIFYL